MAFVASPSSSCLPSCQFLPRPNRISKLPFPFYPNSKIALTPAPISIHCFPTTIRVAAASRKNSNVAAAESNKSSSTSSSKNKSEEQIEEEVEVEEELPWIQDKALDVVEFTGSVTQAIPGPRVGKSSLPWILAIPLAYAGITFVIAFVKTVKKFTSPQAKRKKLVNKNAFLCKSIDELFQKGRDAVQQSDLKGLTDKTGFTMEDILRKYIRYVLNEKPFNPDLVADLIQLRKASLLNDSQVADTLNEISRRIVREKGPVVMDKTGFTEKGFKRKLAVQVLFGKVFYLSELPELGSRDSSLIVKEIFGVTDEDTDQLRLHTMSEAGDMSSLERMVDGSDSEDPNDKKVDST